MSRALTQAIRDIADERQLPWELVREIFEESLKEAIARKMDLTGDIQIRTSETTGDIRIVITQKVVHRPKEPGEITLRQARKYDPDTKVGDTIQISLAPEDFPRSVVIVAKQLLLERIEKEERHRIAEEYRKKVGILVAGTVQKIDRYNILVNLGGAEAILPVSEEIPGEHNYFRQGGNIRAVVLRVDEKDNIILSRTHPSFLKRLMEFEIPEIADGVVEIKAIARIPGKRAKVAVASNDPKVDPVGACVGNKGWRIKPIVKELQGEKIDVLQWSDELVVLVSRALSGARIITQKVDNERKEITVVVEPEDLPKAIGKSGQNAYLASRLVDYDIDIFSPEEYERESVLNITEFTDDIKERLVKHNLFTARAILRNEDDLREMGEFTDEELKFIFTIAEKIENEVRQLKLKGVPGE